MTTPEPTPPRPSPRPRAPAAAEVVRSVEQLRTGTETVVTGRVRVSTRVVTEERTVTVVLRRQELVVEHLPAGRTDPGTGADVDEVVLVLHEERPVVTTEVVPVERVVVRRRTVTGTTTVTAPVAHEVVDVVPGEA